MISCNGRNRLDRLQRAHFVVGVHDADDGFAAIERTTNGLRIDHPLTVDRQDRDLAAEARHECAGFEYRRMLDGAGDHVPVAGRDSSRLAHRSKNRAQQGLVVGFASAAGEHDLIGLRSQQLRHLAAGLFHGIVGGLAVNVRAGWIAEVIAKACQHAIQHGGVDRSRGVAVEIDRLHECWLPEVGAAPYSTGGSVPHANTTAPGYEGSSAPRAVECIP